MEIKITIIIVITVISAISIFLRWFAFNRVDSVALEIAVVSFAFLVFETIGKYQSNELVGKDIIKCVVSLLLVILLSCFHHSCYSSLLERIKELIDRAKPEKKNTSEKGNEANDIKREALDNTLPLARHAIFLTYSYFLEEKFNFYIRRGKKNARENYARLLNSLSKLSFRVQESDLLLPTGTQMAGLLICIVLGGISVLLVALF